LLPGLPVGHKDIKKTVIYPETSQRRLASHAKEPAYRRAPRSRSSQAAMGRGVTRLAKCPDRGLVGHFAHNRSMCYQICSLVSVIVTDSTLSPTNMAYYHI
jgi:hypothetical protein